MTKRRLLNIVSKVVPGAMMLGSGLLLTSCFDDGDSKAETYKEWKERNEQYLTNAMDSTDVDGGPFYEMIIPSWAPNTYVLIHWHNDRSLNQNNLSPMDNSTVSITYELFDIDGKELSTSFTNPDSLYTSKPSSNIIGVWAGLTHMNVGDSVTMVIPSQAGYGEYSNGSIPPYSTLIYYIKMKAIPAYEVP